MAAAINDIVAVKFAKISTQDYGKNYLLYPYSWVPFPQPCGPFGQHYGGVGTCF